MLTPLVPCHGANSGGEVDQTDAALGRVLMLASRASCSEGLDTTRAQKLIVVFRNPHAVIDFGHGEYRLVWGDFARRRAVNGMELTWGNDYSTDSWPIALTLCP